jgi:hypothetical protein
MDRCKLVKTTHGGPHLLLIYCPGCQEQHCIPCSLAGTTVRRQPQLLELRRLPRATDAHTRVRCTAELAGRLLPLLSPRGLFHRYLDDCSHKHSRRLY